MINFLSDSGYTIIINNVLLIPSLAASLFALNQFAQEHCDMYTESVEYPLRQWVNCKSGAMEFTATIHPSDLAFLNWKPVPSVKSANVVSMAKLHSQLNHMPTSAIQHLIQVGTIDGLPKGVPNSSEGEFCEDCVNGKLTWAPHTTLVVRAECPLFCVFSDVHSPLPVCSWHGHIYWVTFIDDHSHFPVVYFLARKSDIFNAFVKYKVWAENLTNQRISIL